MKVSVRSIRDRIFNLWFLMVFVPGSVGGVVQVVVRISGRLRFGPLSSRIFFGGTVLWRLQGVPIHCSAVPLAPLLAAAALLESSPVVRYLHHD